MIYSSGISEEEMTKLQTLLTSVSNLEAVKPNKQLKSLYSKKDRDQAEAERSKALEQVDSDSSDDYRGEKKHTETNNEDEDFEFGPKKGRGPGPSNPKQALVKYLEKKNEVI